MNGALESGALLSGGLPHLLDERSNPDFREVFGMFAARSAGLDAAVARIRLTGLDLRSDELQGLNRIRVLLANVSALSFRAEADAIMSDPSKATNLGNIVALMEEGRIEVRSSPLGGWAPDFSIFHRYGKPWTLMVGLHWFARPYPHRGPALASLHGSSAAGKAEVRFSELWRGGHDIGAPILELLLEARSRARGSTIPASVSTRPVSRSRRRSSRHSKSPVTEGDSPDGEGRDPP